MSKNISIILPVRNEEKYIAGCLTSLVNQNYPKEKVEILVFDGRSKDKTLEILKRFSTNHTHIKVFNNEKEIIPVALNLGIKQAKGDFILRIDAHSEYPLNYILKCIEYLKKTAADNVGGIVIHRGIGFIGEAIALAQSSWFGLGGAKFRTAKKEQYVDTVFSGAWPRQTFEKYGFFDERLVRNQDIEFNAKIRQGGGKIFLTPEIKSYYYCRSSFKGLWTQYFRNGFWNIKTVRINSTSLSLRHFVPLIFVLFVLLLLGFSFFFKLASGLLAFIVASYLFTNFIFSFIIAVRSGIKYFLLLPLTFAVLHFSYGLGSLIGLFKNSFGITNNNS